MDPKVRKFKIIIDFQHKMWSILRAWRLVTIVHMFGTVPKFQESRSWFSYIRIQLFTSVRIRIQGAKPMRIRILADFVCLWKENFSADPDLGSQTNPDPDPDPG